MACGVPGAGVLRAHTSASSRASVAAGGADPGQRGLPSRTAWLLQREKASLVTQTAARTRISKAHSHAGTTETSSACVFGFPSVCQRSAVSRLRGDLPGAFSA